MKQLFPRHLVCLAVLSLVLPFSGWSQPATDSIAVDTLYRATTVGDVVVDTAMRYMGVPYKWGGKTPKGFDCAGFTRYIYGKFGVELPPSAGPQYNIGRRIGRDSLQRGDLVFFGGRHRAKNIGHVGIVTATKPNGGFDFIHASSKGIRITPSNESYYIKRYVGACRVTSLVDTSLAFLKPLFTVADTVPADTTAVDTVAAMAEPPVDTVLTIAMVGDMMLGTDYPTPDMPPNKGEQLFDDVRQLLTEADVAAGNCEGAICTSNDCTKEEGPYCFAFRMPPYLAKRFQEAGFDFLSLANNHINDFDRSGIQETMANLDSLGIAYAGIRGMCNTASIVRDSIRYGFCAFGHNERTCLHLDTVMAAALLQQAREKNDIVIVSFHGGAEGRGHAHLPMGREIFLEENRGSLREFAHFCIDHGADIVFGHGPHVCRAVECYKGHFIAYSLGNFCTPVGMNLKDISGYAPVIVAHIDGHGRLIDGRIHSFIQPYRKGPKLDESNKVAQFIRGLTLSDIPQSNLTIDDDGTFRPIVEADSRETVEEPTAPANPESDPSAESE